MVNLFIIKTIINTTIEFDSVKRNISQLRKIAYQSQALCMVTVKINLKAILYMHTYYEDVYVYAVSQSGDLLKYITDRTDKICLAAVAKEGLALRYVKAQTEQICKIAIHSKGRDLTQQMENYENLVEQNLNPVILASQAYALGRAFADLSRKQSKTASRESKNISKKYFKLATKHYSEVYARKSEQFKLFASKAK